MGAQWSQFFPPTPTFTVADIGSQEGRVFLVTGGYSGIGFELAKVLYQKKGRVYIAGRSESKAHQAIKAIQESATDGGGSLEFLYLDLEDLTTIKSAVHEFAAKEPKLDVLWNNAGVSQPPAGSVSKQGFELQLAVNCLGPYLLTQLLLPHLRAASASVIPGSTRVLWTSSQFVELGAPQGGIVMSDLRETPKDQARNYANSKTGNIFLATECAKRLGPDGIVAASYNPGASTTNLFRHTPWMGMIARPLMYQPRLAALTTLYAGLSEDITLERNGCYIVPWGRVSQNLRQDLQNATKSPGEGGTGTAAEFWAFCEEKTRDYA
ncbi:short-chain dehydrogenase [Apiospora saccharicola]|uniref:Short-chain dehydrogenase n=1 Tax=Apiospora saccharicola TaxID=335842 RepID=A0ABR1W7S5_9PEZI